MLLKGKNKFTFTKKNLLMALTNNDIMKKLRVAHKLRDDDIVKICSLVDFAVTKSELGAIFRNENHEKYMECGDQFLRNFFKRAHYSFTGPDAGKERNQATG